MNRPVIGVTMGDPAGVDPEIIVKACAEAAIERQSRPVVIGAAAVMQDALGLVGSPLALHPVTRVEDCRWVTGTLECLDCANVDLATLPVVQLDEEELKREFEDGGPPKDPDGMTRRPPERGLSR